MEQTLGPVSFLTAFKLPACPVDFSVLGEQAGDTPCPVMSFMGDVNQHPKQISCFIAHTNEKTADIHPDCRRRSHIVVHPPSACTFGRLDIRTQRCPGGIFRHGFSLQLHGGVSEE